MVDWNKSAAEVVKMSKPTITPMNKPQVNKPASTKPHKPASTAPKTSSDLLKDHISDIRPGMSVFDPAGNKGSILWYPKFKEEQDKEMIDVEWIDFPSIKPNPETGKFTTEQVQKIRPNAQELKPNVWVEFIDPETTDLLIEK